MNESDRDCNIEYALHNFRFNGNYIMRNRSDFLFQSVRYVCVQMLRVLTKTTGQHQML